MKEDKKDQLNEDLKKIILSYCEFPDNTYVLEFYRADVVNMVEEIKSTIVEALED